MSGPEHYAEAERLLALAPTDGTAPQVVAEAQVHATLALAAATAGYRTTWTDESRSTTSIYVEGDWTEVFS